MGILSASIQHARATEAEYIAANPVLLAGQIYISTDVFYSSTNSPKFKIGNGVDVWADIDYHPDSTGGAGITELTGDVTAGPGSGSQVATIANDAVTFAKMQNISTNHLIGRHSPGNGDPQQIGLGDGVEFQGGNLRARVANSVELQNQNIQLVGDSASPGNNKYYGTDNNGTKTYHDLPTNGTPILQNSWIINTPASAVGIGFVASSYIQLGVVTIPANTLQSGDYLVIKGVFGTLTGIGNHLVEVWFTNISAPTPAPLIYATGRFGCLGSYGTTSPRMYGFNFPIFLKDSGTFLMPSGRAIPFPIGSVQEGDAFASFQGSYGGTRTNASPNAGAINYADVNYLQFVTRAADTITIYLQGAIVEHYRP